MIVSYYVRHPPIPLPVDTRAEASSQNPEIRTNHNPGHTEVGLTEPPSLTIFRFQFASITFPSGSSVRSIPGPTAIGIAAAAYLYPRRM
jgi:hypothetical protein